VVGRQLWTLVPSVAIVGQFLQTFREYPPSQVGGIVDIEKALQMLRREAAVRQITECA